MLFCAVWLRFVRPASEEAIKDFMAQMSVRLKEMKHLQRVVTIEEFAALKSRMVKAETRLELIETGAGNAGELSQREVLSMLLQGQGGAEPKQEGDTLPILALGQGGK